MSGAPTSDAVWMLARSRGVPLLLRWLVVLGGAASVACTWAGGGEVIPALVVVTGAAVVWSAVEPDGSAPLLALAAILLHWALVVDDVTTPWVMGLGCGMAVLHIAAAAASVTPSRARWTVAMCRRWASRSLLVTAAVAPVWVLVVAVADIDIASSGLLVGASLGLLAAGASWMVGTQRHR